MQNIIDMQTQTRNLISLATRSLTPEQWFTIPTGHDNNIAWNVGHIITVHQSLVYRLSYNETHTTKEFAKMFNPGTSPADWTENPDPSELSELLTSTHEAFIADHANGHFTKYRPYATTTGVSLQTVTDGATFNLFHEGLHLGTILAIRNHF